MGARILLDRCNVSRADRRFFIELAMLPPTAKASSMKYKV